MKLITERLNAVVDTLEQSLTDKPDKGELSRIARCSYERYRRPYHQSESAMGTSYRPRETKRRGRVQRKDLSE